MSDISKNCVACQQSIHSKARICHHCGSAQRSHSITVIAGAVKWAAGLTAVLTLIIATSQVRSLVEEWSKNEKVVADYVAAARLQYEAGDNSVSQALLGKAELLAPTDMDVRNLRLDILMDSLRSYFASQPSDQGLVELHKDRDKEGRSDFTWRSGGDYQAALDFMEQQEIEQRIALGVINSSKQRKSTLLAHLAWFKLLQFAEGKTDVEAIFAQSLQVDPDNVYANAFYGAWMLSRRNSRYKDEQAVKQARLHFETALKQKKSDPWVWSLWHEALSRGSFGAARVERLQLIDDMRGRGVEIGSYLSWSVLFDLFGSWYDEKTGAAVESLRLAGEQFSADELLGFFKWLEIRAFGILLMGDSLEILRSSDMQKLRLLYALGLLHERADNVDKALHIFSKVQLNRNSNTSAVSKKALRRVMLQMGLKPLAVLLVHDSRLYEKLQQDDIILSYQGVAFPNKNQIGALNKEPGQEKKSELEILRNGSRKKLTMDNKLTTRVIDDFIIPEVLLGDNQAAVPPAFRQDVWFSY